MNPPRELTLIDVTELARLRALAAQQPQAQQPYQQPPEQSKPRKKVDTDRPQSFNGSDKGRLPHFLKQVEIYFQLQRLIDEEDKKGVLTMTLKGAALHWWLEHQDEYLTWAQAKEAFQDQFTDYRQQDRAHAKMYAIKQKGDVQQYLDELERLNASAKVPDNELIQIIRGGIRPDLRKSMNNNEELRHDKKQWIKKLVQLDDMESNDPHNEYTANNRNTSRWQKRKRDEENTETAKTDKRE